MANNPRQGYPIPSVKGLTEVITIADPAPGAEWTLTIPQIQLEWRYQILSVTFKFVTDDNVAARYAGLRYFEHTGAFDWWTVHLPYNHVANQTRYYHFALNFPASCFWQNNNPRPMDNNWYAPLPDVELTNLERFGSTTVAIQVGDRYSDIYVLIRRWLDQRD